MPETHHQLTQAPVQPLDVDGVGIAGIGTALFAVATVVLWFGRGSWLDEGRGWWFWVGLAGTMLGLAGVAYTRWRVARRRNQPPARTDDDLS
ncbi:DUF2530 domain-containing protein [Aestuariimicrobium ganziense]|uniref:DUF2530 domain-containing protein n=1 Tax=Aestuariimicrobium ganziense TaxID=2773677 RepID=UPI0019438F7B|nr:DUF2530 domain-containing protein [Aestuariimicrobium ganziense]